MVQYAENKPKSQGEWNDWPAIMIFNNNHCHWNDIRWNKDFITEISTGSSVKLFILECA